jgi:hypothetical protein
MDAKLHTFTRPLNREITFQKHLKATASNSDEEGLSGLSVIMQDIMNRTVLRSVSFPTIPVDLITIPSHYEAQNAKLVEREFAHPLKCVTFLNNY